MVARVQAFHDRRTIREVTALLFGYVLGVALAMHACGCAGVAPEALTAFVPATVDTLNVTEPYVIGCFTDRLAACEQPEEGETKDQCIDREVEEVRPVRFGLEGVRVAFCSTFPDFCAPPAPEVPADD